MEYTKGEWIADNGDSELWLVGEKENGTGIAYLGSFNGDKFITTDRSFEEHQANAHLIAAAPAMYEALKQIYEAKLNTELLRFLQPWFAKVEQALALAEGREQ